MPVLMLVALVLAGAVTVAPADGGGLASVRVGTVMRTDLDADGRIEAVRVQRERGSYARVVITGTRGRRKVTHVVSPKLRAVSALRVDDVTGDGVRDVWFVATATRRAPRRVIARLLDWSGSRPHVRFSYDSKRSKLGRRWAGSSVRLVDVPGDVAGALAVRVRERERLRSGRIRTKEIVYRLGASAPAAIPSPAASGDSGGSSGGGTDGSGGAPPEPPPPIGPHPEGLVAPPEPPVIPPTVFLATTGSDLGTCTQLAPCRSFDRAYHVAAPGQAVELADGDYGPQVLTHDDAKGVGNPVVVFRPAEDADVRAGELRCGQNAADQGSDAIELADMTVADVQIGRCDRFTLRRVTVDGGVFVDSSTNFSMVGGSVGPGNNYHPDVQTVNAIVPRNVLFEGVHFHDWTHDDPSVHVECLQVSDVIGFTVRNSLFTNCDTFDIHVAGTVAPPVRDVVIENNVFEPSQDHTDDKSPAYYGLSVRDGVNMIIRNNSTDQGIALPAPSNVVSNWVIANNIGVLQSHQCDSRITYSHNLWSDARCGSSDRSGPLGFVNAGAGNYKLVPGALAIDHGDPSNSPVTDILGRTRDARPDMGAYEAG